MQMVCIGTGRRPKPTEPTYHLPVHMMAALPPILIESHTRFTGASQPYQRLPLRQLLFITY